MKREKFLYTKRDFSFRKWVKSEQHNNDHVHIQLRPLKLAPNLPTKFRIKK